MLVVLIGAGAWGVDSKLNEQAGPDVPLDDLGRNLEVLWILSMPAGSFR